MNDDLFHEQGDATYQRRLPLYLLLDASISMRQNQAIEGLRRGVQDMVTMLRNIPEARGTVHIKVITFGDHVEATPLTPLPEFTPPLLEANGQATYLGMALRRLDDDARFGHDLVQNSAERKGDLAPVVLIITDGQPTDPPNVFEAAAATIKQRVRRREMNVVAVACGTEIAASTLHEITDTVPVMSEATPARMEALMQWFSQSVAQRSVAASHHIGPGEPPPTPVDRPPPGLVINGHGTSTRESQISSNPGASALERNARVRVNFAWTGAPAIPVVVRSDQPLRDAIAPYVPSGKALDRLSIVDDSGNDMANMLGSAIQDDVRVIVSPAGVMEGGGGTVLSDADQTVADTQSDTVRGISPAQIPPIAPSEVIDDSLRTPPLHGISRMEHVSFACYYPREVAPHQWEPLLVYIALDTPTASAQIDASAAERLKSRKDSFRAPGAPSTTPIRRGARITIIPRLRGFRINPPYMTVEWAEDTQCHEFRLQADSAPSGQSVNGYIQFFEGLALRGELPLSMFVDDRRQRVDSLEQFNTLQAHAYRKTFPSYSRKDARIVVAFETMAEAGGDHYFRDVRALHAGEEWRPAVITLINEADIFQLFWSKASARSREVEFEWRHALTRLATRPNFIRPVYWSPKLHTPPNELSDIDFGYMNPEALGMGRPSLLDTLFGRA